MEATFGEGFKDIAVIRVYILSHFSELPEHLVTIKKDAENNYQLVAYATDNKSRFTEEKDTIKNQNDDGLLIKQRNLPDNIEEKVVVALTKAFKKGLREEASCDAMFDGATVRVWLNSAGESFVGDLFSPGYALGEGGLTDRIAFFFFVASKFFHGAFYYQSDLHAAAGAL